LSFIFPDVRWKNLHYLVTADTDIGIQKSTNQDSTCIKHARTSLGEIVMAVICDGMGGLAKGELASATVVRTFSDWFHKELPFELAAPDLQVIGGKWEMMLKDLNHRILEYGRANGCSLGTTFTGILMVQDQYVVVHVGDSRVYYLGSDLCQLTEDQTVVGREVRSGRMTEEQAKKDSRRNVCCSVWVLLKRLNLSLFSEKCRKAFTFSVQTGSGMKSPQRRFAVT
jgi:PPM family protein phosphatase